MYSKTFTISDNEFNKIKEFMYEKTGVFLKDTKKILVITRLRSRLIQLKMETFEEYYKYMSNNMFEVNYFINAITTNETFFFRNNLHFEYLKNELIPHFINTKKEKKLKIWSSACSTGEEPYSLNIFLREHFPNLLLTWKIEIEASDINTDVIEQAKHGMYSPEKLRNTSQDLKDKYFIERKDEHGKPVFELKQEAKRNIFFKQHNLKDINPNNNFDIVFCRNVIIYFDTNMKERVIYNISKVLLPGGYLFLGHSEGMIGMKNNFKYIQTSIYQLNDYGEKNI